MRGGAHTAHRTEMCIVWRDERAEQRDVVLCSATLLGGGSCSAHAVDCNGRHVLPCHARASHVEPCCPRHGGGRRCPRCGESANVRWWRTQERLTGEAVGGEARELCCHCAEAAGCKIAKRGGVSLEAAAFFAMLAHVGGDVAEHEHWDSEVGAWVGREVEGLVAPHRDRPDGVVRDDVSGAVRRVWFYHGNHVHGYPPEHALHDSVLSMTGRRASDAYAHTMQSMQRFADYGYEVRYVWAHEFHAFAMCARAARRPCEQLLSIVHEL